MDGNAGPSGNPVGLAGLISRKRVAPVGKKIICEAQRRLLCGLSPNNTLDSSSSSQSEQPRSSSSSTPLRELDGNVTTSSKRSAERKKAFFDKVMAKREEARQAELALGGAHNVFTDEAPLFKPSADSTIEDSGSESGHVSDVMMDTVSEVSESQMHARSPPLAGSQGYGKGQASSTPCNARNHTLAPFRQLDVSAVVRLDSSAETTSGEKEVVINFNVDLDRTPTANDSLGDVMGNFRANGPAAKTSSTHSVTSTQNAGGTFTIDRNGPNSTRPVVVEAASSSRVAVESSSTKDVSSIPADGTFIVQKEEKTAPAVANDATFVVPARPARRSLNKVKLQERDDRSMNALSASTNTSLSSSRRNHSSLLDDLDVDVQSPGRIMFAARPAKKVRELKNSPGRVMPKMTVDRKSTDSVEAAISFMDVSSAGQHSAIVEEDSMVDPETDPARGQTIETAPVSATTDSVIGTTDIQTPKKAPGSIGRSRLSAPRATISQDDEEDFSMDQGEAATTSSQTPKANPAQTGTRTAALSTPRPLPHFALPTVASLRKAAFPSRLSSVESLDDLDGSSALSPFQPIDPSRMMTDLPARSGVRPRLPDARVLVRNRLMKSSLFDDSMGSNDFESRRRAQLGSRDEKKETIGSANLAGSAGAVEASNLSSTSQPARHATPRVVSNSHSDADEDELSSAASRMSIAERNGTATDVGSQSGDDDVFGAAGAQADNFQPYQSPVNQPARARNLLLSDSMCSVDTPHRDDHMFRYPSATDADTTVDSQASADVSAVSSAEDDDDVRMRPASPDCVMLRPRKIIKPATPEPAEVGLRRSTRNRMKPVRQWLGEKPVYARSPTTGCSRLVGTNKVVVTDPSLIRARTTDHNAVLDDQRKHQEYLRRQRELKQLQKERKQRRREDYDD